MIREMRGRKAQLNIIPAIIILSIIMGAIYYLPQTVLERMLETREIQTKVWAQRLQQQVWRHDSVTGREYAGIVEPDQSESLVAQRVESAVLVAQSGIPFAGRVDIEGNATFIVDEDRYRDLKPLAGISRYQTFNIHQSAVLPLPSGQGSQAVRVHTELITLAKERVR